MSTIHGILERNARKFPEKEAFITANARLTYPQMNRIANQFARFLQQEGIDRQDRVAIISTNSEYFFFAYFALMKIGAVPMPLNVKLTSGEMIPILENMETSSVLFESDFKLLIDDVHKYMTMSHRYSIEASIEEAKGYTEENLSLSINQSDVCEVMFTSGTTGVPKGAVFTHERLIALAAGIAIEFQLSPKDRALTMMPLSHSAPLNDFFLAPFYCGASHIIGDFTPQGFLRFIHEERATTTFAAPVAYLTAAKDPILTSFDLSSMRIFAYGGSPMPLASYQLVSEAFQNNNFYQVYGLTEAGPNGCKLTPEEHHTKAGSIGKTPVINVEMKVVDEAGKEAADGAYGEIVIKGDSLMIGYYNDDEETEQTIRDGWLHTGDMAYVDEDGYMFIVDRKKDIIVPGGVNVFPREIEKVLTTHPDVYQVSVVGVVDATWGETVKAVIVREAEASVTEKDLKAFFNERLADFKHPRIYRFVEELPHNASGKLLKQKVKEL
ncbi:AMP-binding protein [Salicibibacter cibarius]|uniref:AMP-binding protein n=1 Tax=Salicibibacter cibarius TaxID=2743000 RepID=A0A7T7CDK1_9BACI|nr:AMP-binding protein [Salicibibacter cibarius]QQK78050.1 AMP-binding protein [Salicibibacter cibarius]